MNLNEESICLKTELMVLLSLRRGFPECRSTPLGIITSQGEAIRHERIQIHPRSTGSLGSGTSG